MPDGVRAPGRGATDADAAVDPLAGGDAADGRRRPLRQHSPLPRRRHRRPLRRDPVGARPARLRVGHAGHRAVATPRRRLLGERRRRPHRVGHRRRLPRGRRRRDRAARGRLRRRRAHRPHRRRAPRDPRRARRAEPARPLVAVAADDPARHHRHRVDHQRPDDHPRGHPRRARRAEPARPLVAVAADDPARHHRHRVDHQRPDDHPRGHAGVGPRLRHPGPAATSGTSTPCPRAPTSSGRTRG